MPSTLDYYLDCRSDINEKNIIIYDRDDTVSYYSSLGIYFPPELNIISSLEKMHINSILEIGVGCGRLTHLLLKCVKEYLGIDFAPNMIKAAQKRYGREGIFMCLDARELSKLGGQRFDVIFWSFNGIDTLDHTGRLEALSEIHDTLVSGGHFIFSSHNAAIIPLLFSSKSSDSQLSYYNSDASEIEKRIALNPNYNDFIHDQNAFFIDGCRNFEVFTYFITPQAQILQLIEAGFTAPCLFSLTDGLEKELHDITTDYRQEWIYYWSRKDVE